jgi:hypothetical protein
VGSDAGGGNVLAAFPRFVGVARMFFLWLLPTGHFRLEVVDRWVCLQWNEKPFFV